MLVLWFRNEKLYKAQACSVRSWRRVANGWNKYAQLWNQRFGYEKNIVGVIPDNECWKLIQKHKGTPKHLPKEVLAARRRIRELMSMAPWGDWKN